MNQVKPIPVGMHTLTPYLRVRGGPAAIAFYKKAFGAEVLFEMPMPGGEQIMHAELQIGDSRLMVSDEAPGMGCPSPQTVGGTGSAVFLAVADVDAVYARAVAAGATGAMPPTDMFWGDRFSKLTDPFGHEWAIATHIEDVGPEEMAKRAAAAFAQHAAK